jgi:Family of unknown function (DUF6491)
MMRLTLSMAALALLGGCATTANETAQGPDPRLTAALEGRVAGKPQNCIRLDQATGSEIFRDAILYREGRSRFWLADAPGCGSTRPSDDILVQNVFGSQLCRGDIVRQVERVGGFAGGACAIRSFTPYTKPKG